MNFLNGTNLIDGAIALKQYSQMSSKITVK